MSVLKKIEEADKQNWIADHEFDPNFKDISKEEFAKAAEELKEKFGTKDKE